MSATSMKQSLLTPPLPYGLGACSPRYRKLITKTAFATSTMPFAVTSASLQSLPSTFMILVLTVFFDYLLYNLFGIRMCMLVMGGAFLLCPHGLKLDGFTFPFGAFQTADAVAVVGVVMDVDVCRTSLVTILEERACTGVHLQLEKAESVEDRPDGSQRTNVSAERLMYEDGESHQGEED